MERPPTIVDVWMQHLTPRFLALPYFASLRRWLGEDRLTREMPLSATLRAMDEGGVRLGLLAAWWGPQGPLISNDEVAAFVREYPQQLVGIASVDLTRPMDAVRELRRCVRELGLRGLRVVPWLWNLPLDDRHYYPLYAECVELNIPFCTQVGHTGPLCPSEPGRPIPYLDHMALEFPRPPHRRRAHRLSMDGGDDRPGDQVPQRLHRHLGLQVFALPTGAGGVPARPRPPEDAVRDELPDAHRPGVPGRPGDLGPRCPDPGVVLVY